MDGKLTNKYMDEKTDRPIKCKFTDRLKEMHIYRQTNERIGGQTGRLKDRQTCGRMES
jgi:hypothetical protein